MAERNVNNGGGTPLLGGRSLREMLPISDEDFERYKHQVEEMDHRARSFIRENPTAAVAGAVVVGFLLGRLISR